MADGAVWVSNELAGTLTRIDPARTRRRTACRPATGPRGSSSTAARCSSPCAPPAPGHRGGTLTVLTAAGDSPTLDPALVVDNEQLQLVVLTNDGLIGFRRVAGSAGNALVPDLAVSIPAPTDGGRSYTFQLRPGIRYSTGALVRPAGLPARPRALARSSASGSLSGYSQHRRRQRLPRRAEEALRPLARDRRPTRPRTRSRSTSSRPIPNFLYLLALPPAFRGAGGNAAAHAAGRPAAHGPVRGRLASTRRPASGSSRNPRFREWSRAAQPSGYPDVIDVRYGGSPDARIATVLRGGADLASGGEAPSPAMLAVAADPPPEPAPASNPWDSTWFVALNTQVAPFDNVLARRALNYALDRAHLRDLALGQGIGQVTCQVLPPDLDGYRPLLPLHGRAERRPAPGPAPTSPAPGSSCAARAPPASASRSGPAEVDPVQQRRGPVRRARSSTASATRRSSASGRIPTRRQMRRAAIQVGFYALGPALRRARRLHPARPLAAPPRLGRTGTTARFCDPAIDREIARAEALQTTDPVQATHLWAKIDHELTDAGAVGAVRERRRARGRSRSASGTTSTTRSGEPCSTSSGCDEYVLARVRTCQG